MIVYHGSNTIVETPNLDLSRKNLDFGPGFYTTENKDQAIEFARKVAIRKRQKPPIVNVYDFDIETAEKVLDIMKFSAPDRVWLDFVHENRRGTYTEKAYDLIIGHVANDDVFETLILYEQGVLNAEQTLEALKIRDLYSQFVFKTEKALSSLKFIKSFEIEGFL